MVERQGADHAPVFTVEVTVDGLAPARGDGASRRAGEKTAAETLLDARGRRVSEEAVTTRAGFAAVIGAPNAGKSTLVNRLVGQKVSIVTQKVQTTRFPVRGVAIEGKTQIVLVDTPGVFKPRRRLDRAMVRAAWAARPTPTPWSTWWTPRPSWR